MTTEKTVQTLQTVSLITGEVAYVVKDTFKSIVLHTTENDTEVFEDPEYFVLGNVVSVIKGPKRFSIHSGLIKKIEYECGLDSWIAKEKS